MGASLPPCTYRESGWWLADQCGAPANGWLGRWQQGARDSGYVQVRQGPYRAAYCAKHRRLAATGASMLQARMAIRELVTKMRWYPEVLGNGPESDVHREQCPLCHGAGEVWVKS